MASSREDNVVKSCYIGDSVLLKLLISEGADLNRSDKDGVTPLHIAAGQVHVECAKLLAAHGAALNAVDRFGRTPLHFAVRSGNLEIVQFLLRSGAQARVRRPYAACHSCERWKSVHSRPCSFVLALSFQLPLYRSF